MEKDVNRIKEMIEDFLIGDIDNKDKVIDYILIEKESNDAMAIASDGLEKIIGFNFGIEEESLSMGYSDIPEWEFDLEGYLFQCLESGFEIGYMSDNTHSGVWNIIDMYYPTDILYKNGVTKYLQYCLDNGITKKYLESKTGSSVPDVMKCLKNKEPLNMNLKKEKKRKERGGR